MRSPKCKECNCVWNVPISDYNNKNVHYCHWWCMADVHGNGGRIDISKTGAIGTDGKQISSKEYQTSPIWCPFKKIEEDMIKEQVERLVRQVGNSLFCKYK